MYVRDVIDVEEAHVELRRAQPDALDVTGRDGALIPAMLTTLLRFSDASWGAVHVVEDLSHQPERKLSIRWLHRFHEVAVRHVVAEVPDFMCSSADVLTGESLCAHLVDLRSKVPRCNGLVLCRGLDDRARHEHGRPVVTGGKTGGRLGRCGTDMVGDVWEWLTTRELREPLNLVVRYVSQRELCNAVRVSGRVVAEDTPDVYPLAISTDEGD